MKHFVGNTQNGLPVYVDLIGSEAAKHLAREPRLLTLAAEALKCAAPDKPVVSLEYDMGRAVGYDFVVKTTDADVIFYVRLLRESTYTRFTKNGKPLATRHISMVLRRSQDGTAYSIDNIWVGHIAPARPGSADETPKSKQYWETHAFVFENQPIQPRTLTKTCPY